MQVSVESISNLGRKMKIEVPNERIDAEVEKRLLTMKGKVKIPGFRPGKVPVQVVRQRYGQEVFQEVISEVMQSSYQEAVTQNKLKPASMPEIQTETVTPGKALSYTATFDVYPEFVIAPVDSIEIKRPVAEIQDGDINKVIDNIRRQQKTWEPVERAAERGDQVIMDFAGTIEGEPFEGGKGEAMAIELGSGGLIPGFEDQLEGVKADDQKVVSMNFPEDYQKTELAGKPVQFDVTVKTVSKPVLPEIDDKFCKLFGVEEGGVEALQVEVRANMQRELEQRIQGKIKQQVTEKLLELNQIEVPDALIKREINNLREQAMTNLKQKDKSMFADELFRERATQRVTLGLIMAEIARINTISLDHDRLDKTLAQLAESYDEPHQVISYYRSNPQIMTNIESMVVEDQIVDWVMERSKVTDHPSSFDGIVNPDNNEAAV